MSDLLQVFTGMTNAAEPVSGWVTGGQPTEKQLAAFKAARETTAELLDRLSESDWKREGTHTEHGRYGMDTWLGIYSVHAHDHAGQIRRARGSARK